MRKRLTTVSIAGLLLMALIPGVAFAASIAFSASGDLAQNGLSIPEATSSGDAAAAAGALAGPFFAPFGAATPGIGTFDQSFSGQLDQGDWGAVKNSNIDVTQNSWFTFPLAGSPTFDFETIVGVSWGTFTLDKGKGNTVTGEYAAALSGTLTSVAGCPIPHPITSVGAFVDVLDVGIWTVDAASELHGAFARIAGTIFEVTAVGCAGFELASITVEGTR